MAVRRFILNLGQSNASPFTDGAGWRQFHFPLDLTQATATTLSQGPYRDLFTLPDSWPAPFAAPLDLKGKAIRRLRYLQFYDPVVTGYFTYPHVGRVANATGGAGANSASLFYVEQVFHSSAATQAVTITRVSTSETSTITAVAAGFGSGAGSRITISPAFATIPADGEEFTYQIKAAAAPSGSTVQLTMSFGLVSTYDNSLVGLKFTIAAGTFDITAWNNTTRTATLSSAPGGGIGSLVTLAPRHGTFDTWAYFLPYSPFEGFTTAGKPNPYPQGFNYPSFIHVPPLYNGNPAGGAASYPDSGSYTVGLGVRMSQVLSEDLFVISSEVGATPLAHSELTAGAGGIGWHDPRQHNNWAPGDNNNCFARMLIELDAAVVAAAPDTLQIEAIFHVHGEADAGKLEWSEDWENNLREFKLQVRNALKARNMWPGDAAKIPYIFSKPSRNLSPALVFVENIHMGTNRVATEDAYMRTIVMDDASLITEGDGSKVHYNGSGAFSLEDRAYDAWIDLRNASDVSGAVTICNLALSFIGDSSGVTSIDPVDGSAQATHCARFFPIAFDEVLKMRKWTFASKRLDLTQLKVDTPWAQWPFAYVLPSDYLRAIALLPPGVLDDNVVRQDNVFFDLGNTAAPFSGAPAPVPHSVERDSVGRRVLYTVQSLAVLRYIARVPVRSCPQDFQTLVAWKLAEMLSGAIIKGQEGALSAQWCKQMLLLSLVPQDEADADSRRVEAPHVPATLRGRG